jgi:Protein of unknown function (DUF2878)
VHGNSLNIAVNFVLFQIGWFACVLGAAHDRPWIGVLSVALIAAWHLARARFPAREAILLTLAAACGVVFDSTLSQLGIAHFTSGVVVAGLAPLWMIALWILFATTLNVSLRWLHSRLAMAAALGFVGGALAYYSGVRLGAMTLTPPGTALAIVALGWSLLTPLLLAAARRYDGFAKP